jgi:hypothetical protein
MISRMILFSFSPGRRDAGFMILHGFPFLHTGTISSISYASLYSITRSHEEVDMCLVSVSALVISRRVESTERRTLIVGSPRFCRAKAAQAPPQFLNPRNCDGTPNQTHESIIDSFAFQRGAATRRHDGTFGGTECIMSICRESSPWALSGANFWLVFRIRVHMGEREKRKKAKKKAASIS